MFKFWRISKRICHTIPRNEVSKGFFRWSKSENFIEWVWFDFNLFRNSIKYTVHLKWRVLWLSFRSSIFWYSCVLAFRFKVYFFMALCLRIMCLLRLPRWTNRASHSLHFQGFSAVFVSFWQMAHWCVLFAYAGSNHSCPNDLFDRDSTRTDDCCNVVHEHFYCSHFQNIRTLIKPEFV